jgi:hypothetical protein
MMAAEEERIRNAIRVNCAFGMDEVTLITATMCYLQGQCNAAAVVALARKYLANGRRFPLDK